jgi:tetratricopeptide (TPR) repeat protein
MCNAFLRRTGRRWQRVDIHRAAVAAAERAGDELAWATASCELASSLARLDEPAKASAHLAAALLVLETAGERFGQLQVHLSYTRVLEAQERYEDALTHARRALDLADRDEDPVSYADSLINLGHQYALLGNYTDALPLCTEADRLYEAAGHVEGRSNCLLTIGMIHHRCADYSSARSCYERSSALDRQLGDRYWEAVCLDRLGDVYAATAQPDMSTRCWREALTILESLRHPEAEWLRDKMTGARRESGRIRGFEEALASSRAQANR